MNTDGYLNEEMRDLHEKYADSGEWGLKGLTASHKRRLYSNSTKARTAG